VPGFEANLLTGVVGPAGIPGPIVAKLNAAINDGLKSADIQTMLEKFGSSPRIESPQAFTAFIAGEKQKWSEVAKKAGVSID
jgi:tripartite-type tricarboxylate transporter receptor subunit TctC